MVSRGRRFRGSAGSGPVPEEAAIGEIRVAGNAPCIDGVFFDRVKRECDRGGGPDGSQLTA